MPSIDIRARDVSRQTMGLARDDDLVLAGMSRRTIRRRLHQGTWQRVAPGLIDVGRTRWDRHRRTLAAVMSGPAGTVASHESAAALHDLADISLPKRPHVTVRRARRAVEIDRVVVHTTLYPVEPVVVRGIPATPVPRTLRDLAVGVPDRVLARAVRDALRRGTPARALLDAAPGGHPGSARLLSAVRREVDAGARRLESPLEAECLGMLQGTDLPPPVAQHRLVLADGRTVRLDLAWPDQLVAVEVDGAGWHADALARAADRARRDALKALGWEIVRVTAKELHDLDAFAVVVRRIARLLRA